jgi:hypothetical protein
MMKLTKEYSLLLGNMDRSGNTPQTEEIHPRTSNWRSKYDQTTALLELNVN